MSGTGALDAWVARTIGAECPLSRDDIRAYQFRCLKETITCARSSSPFYRLKTDWPASDQLTRLEDMARLPLTEPDDLIRNDPSLIALPMRDAARLVTIPTSGTTGQQKRLFFTDADIEATVAYFEHGMATLVRPGSSVGVAFPAQRPDSVGDLLMRGLSRLGACPVALPVDGSLEEFVAALRELRPAVIAGMPVTLGAAARQMAADGGTDIRIETALVSADSVLPSLRAALAVIWGTEVFEHWGMTETGYGGALACDAHDGLHIRENELFVEIVDAVTGDSLSDGEEGEIVISTLHRRGQPLIRYRTGDCGSIIGSPCRCGSVLRRLRLGGRMKGGIQLAGGGRLAREVIEETVFAVDGVIDFEVELRAGRSWRLVVEVVPTKASVVDEVRRALVGHSVIGELARSAEVDVIVYPALGPPFPLCRKRKTRLAGVSV